MRQGEENMNASEIRRMKTGFEHNVLPGEVYSALALIEIAAQLAEMNQANSQQNKRSLYDIRREKIAAEEKARDELNNGMLEDNYVAWLRFDRNDYDNTGATLELCDSDAEGAFKVFRRR
jgi:hypothetical protein